MNDPFELRGALVGHPRLQEALLKQLSTFGVLCFSRTWTNTLLWSHYADKHKGICLGFELPPSVPAYKPDYVSEPEAFDAALEGVIAGEDIATFERLVKKILLLKYREWSYEDEIRLMTSLDKRDGPYAFKSFGEEQLTLCEVMLGLRCPRSVDDVFAAVTDYADLPRIYKAELCSEHFEITRSEIGRH